VPVERGQRHVVEGGELVEEVETEHKEEVVELPDSEMDATAKEFAAPQSAKVSDGKSRRHRSRKNRKNGHTNEEIPDGQIRTSMDQEDNFPKNGKTQSFTDKETNTTTDQPAVPVDQTEE